MGFKVKFDWFSCSSKSSEAESLKLKQITEGKDRFWFLILTNRFGCFYSFWTAPDTSNHIMSQRRRQDQELQLVSEDCNTKRVGFQVQLIRTISPSICTLLLGSSTSIYTLIAEAWDRQGYNGRGNQDPRSHTVSSFEPIQC
jgi:hypothetical protein